MERFPKVKFIVFTIIIITLINIVALVIILRYSYKEHCGNDNIEKKDASHKGFDYIKDYLNLSPQQVDLFKNEKDSFFSNANVLFDQLEDKRQEMIQQLSIEKPDTTELYRISDEMGGVHGKLKRNVVNHVLKLRSYCNPEQVVKLDSLYNKMIRTDSPWRNKHKQEEGKDKHK